MAAILVECARVCVCVCVRERERESLVRVRFWNLVWSDGCETSYVFVFGGIYSFKLATSTPNSTPPNYCSIHAAVENGTPRRF